MPIIFTLHSSRKNVSAMYESNNQYSSTKQKQKIIKIALESNRSFVIDPRTYETKDLRPGEEQ